MRDISRDVQRYRASIYARHGGGRLQINFLRMSGYCEGNSKVDFSSFALRRRFRELFRELWSTQDPLIGTSGRLSQLGW